MLSEPKCTCCFFRLSAPPPNSLSNRCACRACRAASCCLSVIFVGSSGAAVLLALSSSELLFCCLGFGFGPGFSLGLGPGFCFCCFGFLGFRGFTLLLNNIRTLNTRSPIFAVSGPLRLTTLVTSLHFLLNPKGFAPPRNNSKIAFAASFAGMREAARAPPMPMPPINRAELSAATCAMTESKAESPAISLRSPISRLMCLPDTPRLISVLEFSGNTSPISLFTLLIGGGPNDDPLVAGTAATLGSTGGTDSGALVAGTAAALAGTCGPDGAPLAAGTAAEVGSAGDSVFTTTGG
jgi:hypothetical protein